MWMEDKKMTEKIMNSREVLIKAHILKASAVNLPIFSSEAHQDKNDDFRLLCAASVIG